MRHLFDTRDNDPHKALCKHFKEGDLIRMVMSNVDCPHCIRLAKHPDFDKVDDEITPGWRPQVVSELEDEGPEKLYLVCVCGEAFDSIAIAAGHAEVCGEQPGVRWEFDIQPESEAM